MLNFPFLLCPLVETTSAESNVSYKYINNKKKKGHTLTVQRRCEVLNFRATEVDMAAKKFTAAKGEGPMFLRRLLLSSLETESLQPPEVGQCFLMYGVPGSHLTPRLKIPHCTVA